MTPEFAKAVDPVFLSVLRLLERIGNGENVSVEDERARIKGRLDQAAAMLGQGPDWQIARYALVSWIDEVLIDAPWQYSEWWKEHTLESEDFKTQDRSEQFYLKAKEAAALRSKDAMEVFYVGVVLGFRGLYRYPDRAAALCGPFELAPDLETWAKQTAMAIQLGRGRPPISEASAPIEGAPPLDGRFTLLWAAILATILSVLAVMTYLFVRT
jgi:type VI secretion system protein ImpK